MKQFTCVFFTIILLLTLAACQKAPEVEPVDEALDWQTQYDLGVRYLSEGNYEEAILAFEAAIKIDPKNADAYRKLAEAYEQTGERMPRFALCVTARRRPATRPLPGRCAKSSRSCLKAAFRGR